METIVWLVLFLAVPVGLAYRRTDLLMSTLVLGVLLAIYSVVGAGGVVLKTVLWIVFAAFASLNARDLAPRASHAPASSTSIGACCRTMSRTEQDALEAGGIWWDGELFSGIPDWRKLLRLPAPQLTPEEQAFLDGPVEELCRMLDDWQITHELLDMPPEVWQFLKEQQVLRDDHPAELRRARLLAARVLDGAHEGVVAERDRVVDDWRAQFARPGRAPTALRHRRAEAVLAAAARVGRRGAVLRADFAARRLRRDRDRRPRRRREGRLRRPRGHRDQAELGQALHHTRADRDRARPRLQAL